MNADIEVDGWIDGECDDEGRFFFSFCLGHRSRPGSPLPLSLSLSLSSVSFSLLLALSHNPLRSTLMKSTTGSNDFLLPLLLLLLIVPNPNPHQSQF